MATLVSCTSGNWTSASTWALVDSTSYLDSEAGGTTVGTSTGYSQTFTPGAITIDAIGLKFNGVAGSGTFTLTLNNSTDAVDVASVTVDKTDLQVGWNMFKLAAPLTLTAGKAYRTGVTVSVTGSGVYNNGTPHNHTRMLRRTTTQLPVAGDQIHIVGELTGQGTGNDITVTMNNTATTLYGDYVGSSIRQSITVNNRGVLTAATAGSTNYNLRHKGVFMSYPGSTVTFGTSGTPIPSTSTLTFETDNVANIDSGWNFLGGTVTMHGNPLSVVWDRLAADALATATSLTTVNSTGWKNGDVIAIPSTTTTNGSTESKALTADASGTTLTIEALTFAHSGSNSDGYDTRCELGNMTRNVKFKGESATLQAYMTFGATTVTNIKYVEFQWLGSGTGQRGISVATTTGSFDFQYNSLHDFEINQSVGLFLSAGSGNDYTISNNVWYNVNIATNVVATSQVHTWNNNLVVGGGTGFHLADSGGNFMNNHAAGCSGVGMTFTESNSSLGTFSNNVAHSCGNIGMNMNSAPLTGTMSNCRVWRNGSSAGLAFGTTASSHTNIIVDGLIAFGNVTAGISTAAATFGTLTFRNSTINAGVIHVQPIGLNFPRYGIDINIENCTFGTTNPHTTGDIQASTTNVLATCYLSNTILASTTEVASQSLFSADSLIWSDNHDQTTGSYMAWTKYGTLTNDTLLYSTASPSLRMTPINASEKLEMPLGRGFRVAVLSGNTCTVGVMIRKSLLTDAALYNGNEPRLMVRKNIPAGITSDTLVATMSAAAGNWELVTGTTATVGDDCVLEFYVDCDGTAGWVNIDDFTTTTVNDTKGFKFFEYGSPTVFADNSSGGVSSSLGYAY